MNAPYNYLYTNVAGSTITPATLHITGTPLARFFHKYLLEKLKSVYKWTMPEHWDEGYVLHGLYENQPGSVVVFATDRYGIIPQHCGLGGRNIYYKPTRAIVANPLINTSVTELRIGENCEVLHILDNYDSPYDLVQYYGDMMALCAQAAGVNIANSKLSYIMTAESKAGAEALKKLFDKVMSGEPCAVADRAVTTNAPDARPSWQTFAANIGQNYIADRLIIDLHKWEHQFDEAIGIPSANTDKRERLVSAEVDANAVGTSTRADRWLETLQIQCADVRKMFGVDLRVEWRVKPEEGGDDLESDVQSDGPAKSRA